MQVREVQSQEVLFQGGPGTKVPWSSKQIQKSFLGLLSLFVLRQVFHCNRVRCHGPVPFLKKLKIIRKAKGKPDPGVTLLEFGKHGGSFYTLRPKEDSKPVLRHILYSLGPAVHFLRQLPKPKNCFQYGNYCGVLRTLLQKAGFGETYSGTWMCRTILLPELSATERNLEVYAMDGSEPDVPSEWIQAQMLEHFAQHYPDQRGHLKRFMDEGITDIVALREHLQWHDVSVAAITLLLCMFGDRHLRGPNVNWEVWLAQDREIVFEIKMNNERIPKLSFAKFTALDPRTGWTPLSSSLTGGRRSLASLRIYFLCSVEGRRNR